MVPRRRARRHKGASNKRARRRTATSALRRVQWLGEYGRVTELARIASERGDVVLGEKVVAVRQGEQTPDIGTIACDGFRPNATSRRARISAIIASVGT